MYRKNTTQRRRSMCLDINLCCFSDFEGHVPTIPVRLNYCTLFAAMNYILIEAGWIDIARVQGKLLENFLGSLKKTGVGAIGLRQPVRPCQDAKAMVFPLQF